MEKIRVDEKVLTIKFSRKAEQVLQEAKSVGINTDMCEADAQLIAFINGRTKAGVFGETKGIFEGLANKTNWRKFQQEKEQRMNGTVKVTLYERR